MKEPNFNLKNRDCFLLPTVSQEFSFRCFVYDLCGQRALIWDSAVKG